MWLAALPFAIALGTHVAEQRKRAAKAGPALTAEEWERGPQPVLLEWQEVTVRARDRRGGTWREILSDASGCARPGRILAVLGASGGGKSTLLRAVAGRSPAAAHAYRVEGRLRVRAGERDDADGDRADDTAAAAPNAVNGMRGAAASASATHSLFRAAYIEQEESFFSELTARETLSFYAELLLPRRYSKAQRAAYVENMLRELGLSRCADGRVGDQRNPGLSGGERKRLSIGCELFGNPSIIFADEPTTGLDANQALKVMEVFRRLADEGRTVVCSLHQPRSSILDLVDDLVLVSDGKVVYAGEARMAVAHFERVLGARRPPNASVAEWLVDEIAVDPSNPQASQDKMLKLVSSLSSSSSSSSSSTMRPRLAVSAEEAGRFRTVPRSTLLTRPRPTATLWTQARALLWRAWRQAVRDRRTNMARLASTIFSSLLFGAIYYKLGRSQPAIQDRLGLLQVSTVNTAMSALVKTLNIFPDERLIATKERARGMYYLPVYLVTKLVAEAPIASCFPLLFGMWTHKLCGLQGGDGRYRRYLSLLLVESFASAAFGLAVGAVAPSTQAATAIGPALMVIFIIFGGLSVTNPPAWARRLPDISLIRWAFVGLAVNELRDMPFETTGEAGEAHTGDDVLRRLRFSEFSVADALWNECKILASLYGITLWLLMRRESSGADGKLRLSVIE
ncbi:hypothetical protein CDCA_CDCA08G2309 [Cyanidium caldarium]|uniref:Probable ATP-dependent transporter ycf16 n=1 Tax=Cyanidium caldarium TaxID=2771 RepID=A0AAV9IVX3_CYACA|nr:hypothetical protein CDCA_CDCA08G2309 [Cyanidium caldarium]